ncbi:uncharacterized protein LOC131248481 [Magnolia sinica]|uniref:uncharacterized protein LOC131248481 n=1 Tax=Magnolia sinica TaxID=86752 RepID=UPI00265A91FC|nr:uncharacterized protein LOC131248481 [Magnolia sinica]
MASSHGARPVLLKDFLRDDQHSSDDDDFLSFPRRSDTTVRKLLEIDLSAGDLNSVRRLRRSRSKAAASTAISAFQKASEAVINAVKLLPFSSVKSPSSSRPKQKLRRSFWKNNEREVREIRGRVRVRDIVRWRSFGDEEGKKKNKKPLDFTFPSSTNTITTTTSSHSSWSESDFTSDFVRSSSGSSVYSAENEGYDGKKHSAEISRSTKRGGVGEDSMETATCYGERKGAEGEGGSESPYEEKEQLSPVSVLDFPCEDEETPSSSSSSSFQQSLANMERTKQQLLQKIRRFECLAELEPVDLVKRIAQSELEDDDDDDEEEEEEEDKLMDLLKHFKASYGESQKTNIDRFLIDFFREGLSMQEREDDEVEKELLRAASNWMNGLGAIIWGVQDTREEHLKEIERGGRWRKFDEGKGELVVELEVGVLSSLVEELMLDLLS